MKKKISLAVVTLLCAIAAFTLAGCFESKPKTFTYKEFAITASDDWSVTTPSRGDDVITKNEVLAIRKGNTATAIAARIPREELQPYNVFDLQSFADFTQVYYGHGETMETVETDSVKFIGYALDYTDSYGNDNTQFEALYEGDNYFYEVSFICEQTDFDAIKPEFVTMAKSIVADNVKAREPLAAKSLEVNGLTLNLNASFAENAGSYTNGAITVSVTQVNDMAIVSLDGLQNYVNGLLDSPLSFLTGETEKGYAYASAEYTFKDENRSEYYDKTALYMGDKGGYIVEFIAPEETSVFCYAAIDAFINTVSGSALEAYKQSPAAVTAQKFAVEGAYYTGEVTLDNTYVEMILDRDVCYTFSLEHGDAFYVTAYTEDELLYNYATSDLAQFAAYRNESMKGDGVQTDENGVKYMYNADIAAAFKQTENGIVAVQYAADVIDEAAVDKLLNVINGGVFTVQAADLTPQDVTLGAFTLSLDKTYTLYQEETYDYYYSTVTGLDVSLSYIARADKPTSYTLNNFITDTLRGFGLYPSGNAHIGNGFYMYEAVDTEYDERCFYVFSMTDDFFVVQYYVAASSDINAVNVNHATMVKNTAKTLVQTPYTV